MSSHHTSAAWARFKAAQKPRIKAALPLPCVDCGRAVTPDQKWQVGHIIPVSLGGEDTADNVGPSHTGCNASAGGRMGASKTNKKRAAQNKREGGW